MSLPDPISPTPNSSEYYQHHCAPRGHCTPLCLHPLLLLVIKTDFLEGLIRVKLPWPLRVLLCVWVWPLVIVCHLPNMESYENSSLGSFHLGQFAFIMCHIFFIMCLNRMAYIQKVIARSWFSHAKYTYTTISHKLPYYLIFTSYSSL